MIQKIIKNIFSAINTNREVACIGIFAIVFLETVALLKGIDGTMFGATIGGICGIMGFVFGSKKQKKGR